MIGKQLRMRCITSLALSLLLSSAGVHAQSDKVGTVINEQVKAEEAAQVSQRKIAQLDDEATKMLAEYRLAIAEAQSLKSYNDQLETQVRSQDQELQTMTRQLGEIETTSREVLPMMQKMVATLEQFVTLDVPFLLEERTNRVVQLQDLMGRADVSTSEKYRRIVEAYQIEIEYGRTLEAYQSKVEAKTVDFLRVGRVALMYQTLDGRETGYWDAQGKRWVVDGKYQRAVREGLKVAKKQAAPNFIKVAVPAPKEVA